MAHSGRAFRSEEIGGILEPASPRLVHGLDEQRQIVLAGPGFHPQRPDFGLIQLECGQPFLQQNKHHLKQRLMSRGASLAAISTIRSNGRSAWLKAPMSDSRTCLSTWPKLE